MLRRFLSPESLARTSSRRPWTTIGIWILTVVVALFLVANLLGDAITTQFVFTNTPEAQRGVNLLEDLRGEPSSTNEVVIVQSDSLTVDDPAFEQKLVGLFDGIVALGPEVVREGTITNYYQSRDPFLVSQDRRTTIIPFVMAGDFDDATDNIGEVIKVVDEAKGQQGFEVLITGQATVGEEFQEISESDLQTGEAFGIPIALIILVLVLGTLVAAIIPVILAIVSIVIALGVASVVGQAFALSFFVPNIIFMIGLAVGIDYSLFIIARYREERARGLDKLEAIGRSGSTASRAVFFSGMTVVLALIGMLLVPFNVFIGLGLGAILVVVASVLAAMTLLPATLSLLGDKIDALSIPWVGKAQRRYDETHTGGFWDRVSRGVMRRPVVSIVLAGGLLVAAAVPFFDLNIGFAGVSTMPDDSESKQGFLILDEKFSAGEVTPAEIVIEGAPDSPDVRSGIQRLTDLLAADAAFGSPREESNSALGLTALTVSVAGDSATKEAEDAIKRLRSDYVPTAFSGIQDKVYVTGETAYNLDFFEQVKDSSRIMFPFVLGISFLLLMLVFRSIVVPLKAIIMNLLAVGASYGLLVLIFQKGWLAGTFGLQESPIVEAWIPLFLFAILFGLSMDYHVFLLSRIREHFDGTGDNTESVAFGIRSTGRLITGAALIMVSIFWAFAAGELVGLQQMGFGLGTAILLDATIIRMVLVPASMRLLGQWNWYLPRWLHWLPDLRVEPQESAAAPAPAGSDD
ncbi:MAG: MMPL family transporter [Chloroflexi bacterium]|nr:MMPL family transporter [Chloroflexota bacterium]